MRNENVNTISGDGPELKETPCSKKSFGTWLKSARTFHGLTLREVSDKCGVTISHLCELEKGDRPNPSLEAAGKITRAFGMELWRVLKLLDI